MAGGVTTFGLVHGGMHGAWCWERVRREFNRLGYRSVAVELPCDDVRAGAAAYADAAVAAFRDVEEDLVVVGHSLGGLTIPLVALQRPVVQLVFVCALIPVPGFSQASVVAEHPEMFVVDPASMQSVDSSGRHIRSEAQAKWLFYHDVPESIAHEAFTRLRPQSETPLQEVTPLEQWPDVGCSYIYAAEDHLVSAAWATHTVPSLLRVEPFPVPGGHSPFLSQPRALAELLVELLPGSN